MCIDDECEMIAVTTGIFDHKTGLMKVQFTEYGILSTTLTTSRCESEGGVPEPTMHRKPPSSLRLVSSSKTAKSAKSSPQKLLYPYTYHRCKKEYSRGKKNTVDNLGKAEEFATQQARKSIAAL